jgi:multiple sugar transport system permease protein
VKNSRRESLTALLFVSPWLVGFCVFLLYPLSASIYYSFCNYSVLKPPVWIGLANYRNLIQDDVFTTSLKNTLAYAAMALPTGMAIAIGLAMMLNAKIRGQTIYRTIFYVPSLVPGVPLAVLWLWVFNGKDGVINAVLQPMLDYFNHLAIPVMGHMHLAAPQWLSSPTWAKPALVLMSVWGAGNAMLIYLAGLQDVPVQLYEAADLDGAGWWSKTRHVTLPMLSPVILFNGVMGIIGALQVFTIPYIMFPGGSPARSTYFYAMYLYDNAFLYLKMGYACAMGWIMFVITVALTIMALKLSSKHVHYQGG